MDWMIGSTRSSRTILSNKPVERTFNSYFFYNRLVNLLNYLKSRGGHLGVSTLLGGSGVPKPKLNL